MRPLARWGRLLVLLLLFASSASARADKVDDLIRTLLSTDSYKVKVQVCLVLGKLGDRRALPALQGALHDDEPTVRLVASQALGRLGDRAALDDLNGAARDAVPSVAAAARQAIASIQKGVGGHAGAAAGARFFINVGPLSSKARGGGAESVHLFREYLVRELGKTPGVSLEGAMQKGQTGYYVDGNIVRLSTAPAGSFSEVSCDLKVLVATWPGKSIIMWTDGGATVQVGASPSQQESGVRDCLEAAVQSVRENIATFLKAQQ